MTTGSKCGATTHQGRPCEQPTGVFPCRYHDRRSFNAVLRTLTGVVEDAGGWSAFLAEHGRAEDRQQRVRSVAAVR
jgi:hypothetical protein